MADLAARYAESGTRVIRQGERYTLVPPADGSREAQAVRPEGERRPAAVT